MDDMFYTKLVLALMTTLPLEQRVLLYPYVMSTQHVSDFQSPVVSWEASEVTC